MAIDLGTTVFPPNAPPTGTEQSNILTALGVGSIAGLMTNDLVLSQSDILDTVLDNPIDSRYAAGLWPEPGLYIAAADGDLDIFFTAERAEAAGGRLPAAGGPFSLAVPQYVRGTGIPITAIRSHGYAYYPLTGTLQLTDLVTDIGDYAFSGTAISEFSGNPVSIGAYAFSNCGSLNAALHLNEGFAFMGERAFLNCSSLTDVYLPNTLEVIPVGAFAYSGITSLNFTGDGLKSIGAYAFQNCSELTNMPNWPATLESIGSRAFTYTPISGVLMLPNSITTLGDGAFSFCTNVTGLHLPNNLQSVGDGAFSYLPSLEEAPTMPASLSILANGMFIGCSSMTGTVTIPGTVTTIGSSCFYACFNLQGVQLSEGLTTIGSSAFCYCTLGGTLELPSTLSSIGNSAFAGCSGLTGGLTIPSGVESLPDYVFAGCSGFHGALTLPEGLTEIRTSAFDNCANFSGYLEIPDTVTYIGSRAFANCNGFGGALVLPSNLTSLGGYAFSGCAFNGELVIPGTVGTVSYGAFYGGQYSSVVFSEGIVEISPHAFHSPAMTQFPSFPSTLTSIGDYAFLQCNDAAGTLTIPASVTYIGVRAFSGNAMVSVTRDLVFLPAVFGDSRPASLTISDAAFHGAGFTGNLILPEGTYSLGAYAFVGNNFSGMLVLPSSLLVISATSIDGLEFDDLYLACPPSALNDVTFLGTPTVHYKETASWQAAVSGGLWRGLTAVPWSDYPNLPT